jgi:hypothetical protein
MNGFHTFYFILITAPLSIPRRKRVSITSLRADMPWRVSLASGAQQACHGSSEIHFGAALLRFYYDHFVCYMDR